MTRQQIFDWVSSQYGTEPEYLWAKYPGFAVLRNSSGKWYGAVMNIAKNKLGLDGDEIIDILDVKCDPLLIGSLRMQNGYLPAYHMNKNSWITVILDGSVEYEQIKNLIDLSYELTMPKKRK